MPKKVPYIFTKFVILNPYKNRDKIAAVGKGAKGVYIFFVLKKEAIYVGSSINLYSRVCSYFMPSILSKADRYVLRYFRKHGFNNVELTLLVMDNSVSNDQVIELEQYLIDNINPNLNIDKVAASSGYHKPMSEKAKIRLRKLRGQPFYVYDVTTKSLIYIFDSKQYAYNKIGIAHDTLNKCLTEGELYLDRIFFSLEYLTEFPFESLISLVDLKSLIKLLRIKYKVQQPASKAILAQNFSKPKLSKQYSSITEFAKAIKGDRGTIRNYLNGIRKGLYKKQWKLSFVNKK